MRPSILWACLGLCLLLPTTLQAESVQVTVKPIAANTSLIALDTDVNCGPEPLWKLLTDFNHQAQFLPYISKSEIVGKEGSDLLIDQAGTIRIFFWTFTMHMKQRVTEDPMKDMHFKTIEGDFKRLEGDFLIGPGRPPSLTHLSCHFTVEPKRRVPDWAVRMAARLYLKKMVRVLAEKAEESH
jgi:ribosome-associated toxin RatA of RatAB toxin-antitoxin module